MIKMPEDSFTWSRWRAFNLFKELGIAARYSDIMCFRSKIISYAIGYIKAESLKCRPKENCYAVMFCKDDVFSWCHLSEREFYEVFRQP